MDKYKICVIGGWCGNRMVMVAEHLQEMLDEHKLSCRVITHSVWESYTRPPACDLVLQLLPAFTEQEINCPVINIKPLLADLDHPATIQKVLQHVQASYPVSCSAYAEDRRLKAAIR